MTADETGDTPETPRGDDRPRPQFGELAPPGWEWKPEKPVEPMTRAADHPTVRDATGVYRADHDKHQKAPDAASGASGKPVPRWDRPLALSLLIFSVFGVAMAWGTLATLPEALQQLHETAGLPDYVPAASVALTLTVSSVLQALIWASSVWFTITRLRQHRRAAWIPVVAGALSLIAILVATSIVLNTDQLLLENADKLMMF